MLHQEHCVDRSFTLYVKDDIIAPLCQSDNYQQMRFSTWHRTLWRTPIWSAASCSGALQSTVQIICNRQESYHTALQKPSRAECIGGCFLLRWVNAGFPDFWRPAYGRTFLPAVSPGTTNLKRLSGREYLRHHGMEGLQQKSKSYLPILSFNRQCRVTVLRWSDRPCYKPAEEVTINNLIAHHAHADEQHKHQSGCRNAITSLIMLLDPWVWKAIGTFRLLIVVRLRGKYSSIMNMFLRKLFSAVVTISRCSTTLTVPRQNNLKMGI